MKSSYAIQASNLTKYYGDLLAVDHISFEVHAGEIFGFLGPNGAGKTTTVRIWSLILMVAFALSAIQCTNFSPAIQAPTRQGGSLTIVFPPETTELAGGQSLRVMASLMDPRGQPVEGARVQTELRPPNGDVFTTLSCADKGQGRYLPDYVRLPLQGTEGTWHVVVRATWGDECRDPGGTDIQRTTLLQRGASEPVRLLDRVVGSVSVQCTSG